MIGNASSKKRWRWYCYSNNFSYDLCCKNRLCSNQWSVQVVEKAYPENCNQLRVFTSFRHKMEIVRSIGHGIRFPYFVLSDQIQHYKVCINQVHCHWKQLSVNFLWLFISGFTGEDLILTKQIQIQNIEQSKKNMQNIFSNNEIKDMQLTIQRVLSFLHRFFEWYNQWEYLEQWYHLHLEVVQRA